MRAVTQGMVEEAKRELRNHTRWRPTEAAVRAILVAALRVEPEEEPCCPTPSP